QILGLLRAERLGVDDDLLVAARADDLRRLGGRDAGVGERGVELAGAERTVPRRELERRAALELHAVVEAPEDEAEDADQQDHRGGQVPALAATDEVDPRLAAVQAPEHRHQLPPFSRSRARRAAARSAAEPGA